MAYRISNPARIGSSASVSRPKARRLESRFVEQPGLIGFGQRRGHPLPGLLEKAGHRAQIRAEGAEFLRAVEPIIPGSPQDAIHIDFFARLLLQTRQAAVGHRLVEGLQAGQPVRVVGHAGLEVLVEPPVAFAPGFGLALAQGLGQVLAHQRVGVDGWRIGLGRFDQAAGL